MVFEEISESDMGDDFIQDIGIERSIADIAVELEEGNPAYSNFKKAMGAYEAALDDIENTWHWKGLTEIDLERARYLLSTDEMLEEMLSKTKE